MEDEETAQETEVMNERTASQATDGDDDKTKLRTVHALLIDNVLTILREGKPLKASMLTAIRQLLSDQDINMRTLSQPEMEPDCDSLKGFELPFP